MVSPARSSVTVCCLWIPQRAALLQFAVTGSSARSSVTVCCYNCFSSALLCYGLLLLVSPAHSPVTVCCYLFPERADPFQFSTKKGCQISFHVKLSSLSFECCQRSSESRTASLPGCTRRSSLPACTRQASLPSCTRQASLPA